jgi:hypothetical protein
LDNVLDLLDGLQYALDRHELHDSVNALARAREDVRVAVNSMQREYHVTYSDTVRLRVTVRATSEEEAILLAKNGSWEHEVPKILYYCPEEGLESVADQHDGG